MGSSFPVLSMDSGSWMAVSQVTGPALGRAAFRCQLCRCKGRVLGEAIETSHWAVIRSGAGSGIGE